ncbi:MAG: Molybdopterin-guanine dinucleotide biosynthesis protein [Gemmatimonadetes bacterium]|nr:Molybdopterin-guanine dinucleotide biosynthesis protein [Gemmatimonadota bacterium]
MAAALAGETDGLLLIGNSPDAASWLPHVLTVADVRPERGSLVGIHTALTQARATVFVVAWDMPFVSRELVRLIRDRAAGVEFATVPCGMDGPEPFCAIYTPACLPHVEAAIDAGDLRMSNLLARLPRVTYVPEADVSRVGDPDRLFFNVNDASDLAAAELLVSDRPDRA